MVMAVSLVVAAIWFFLLTRIDVQRRDKNSVSKLFLFFVAGIGSFLISHFLYFIFQPWYLFSGSEVRREFLLNFIFVGPVEEMCKFGLFFALSARLRTIHEKRDGLLQAAAVGLGFAIAENVDYGLYYGVAVLLRRSFLVLLGHMTLAAIWGSQWARVYVEDIRWKGSVDLRPLGVALGIAALDHAFYNSMFAVDPGSSYSIDILTLGFAAIVYYHFHEESPFGRMSLWGHRKAIPRLEKALQTHPKSYVLNRKLAMFHLYTEDWNEALRRLSRCQKVRPRSAEIAFYRSIGMLGAGDNAGGRTLLTRSLTKLSRKGAEALTRSLIQLVLDRELRDRLRQIIKECGGPYPEPDMSRPKAVPFRIVRSDRTWADVVAKRRIPKATAKLRVAMGESKPAARPADSVQRGELTRVIRRKAAAQAVRQARERMTG